MGRCHPMDSDNSAVHIARKEQTMRIIDADALCDAMYHEAFETDTDMQKWDSGCWIRYKMFENVIDEAPTIEPKRGEWIDMGDFEQCSVCKGTHLKEFQSYYGKTTWIKTPYCPNCGADMRGKDNE